MTVADRIKNRRISLGLTQEELAERMGYTGKSSISKIETSGNDITLKKIKRVAGALLTTPHYLMGWEDEVSKDKTFNSVKIRVFGRVAAGIPIEAIEDIYDYEEIPESMALKGEYFGLLIRGDSMIPDLRDGDIVIVRHQPDAENGETVIATINGNDACCKRLMKYAGGIQLLSNNPAYSPMMFSNEDIEQSPVRILGKVVELRRKY